jgi:hypothetical protein
LVLHPDEFDDALPPLEDMLLLITNPKIHEKYNYEAPKSIPYAIQQQMLEKQQQEQAQRLAFEQANRNRGQPQTTTQVYRQQQHAPAPTFIDADPLPDLAQPAWSVHDCNTLVQYLKKLLMAVLQGTILRSSSSSSSSSASLLLLFFFFFLIVLVTELFFLTFRCVGSEEDGSH